MARNSRVLARNSRSISRRRSPRAALRDGQVAPLERAALLQESIGLRQRDEPHPVAVQMIGGGDVTTQEPRVVAQNDLRQRSVANEMWIERAFELGQRRADFALPEKLVAAFRTRHVVFHALALEHRAERQARRLPDQAAEVKDEPQRRAEEQNRNDRREHLARSSVGRLSRSYRTANVLATLRSLRALN